MPETTTTVDVEEEQQQQTQVLLEYRRAVDGWTFFSCQVGR